MNELLLKLLGLVSDDKKAEAQTVIDTINGKIDELDTKITTEEKLKNEAIKSRDEAKLKLKEIAVGIGAEVDNVAEAVTAIKDKKAGNDTIKDKEIEQLKKEVADLTEQKQAVETSTSEQIKKMKLKSDIALALPKYKVKANAIEFVTNAVESMATLESGEIVFKNADGTTKRIDGADATVEVIIKEMYEKEKKANESMFFDISVQPSGANGGGGGGTNKEDFVP